MTVSTNVADRLTKRREERLYLSTFSLGHFANDWTAGSLLLLTPAIALAMDLGPTEIGLMLTLNGLGGGLAYLPAGLAADHTRRRGLLLLLTFWWVAIGYFIASLAPGYWSLTILLAIAVMGDAAWHPIATGALTQLMPDRKARALGVHAMGGTIGAEAIAPLAVGFLLVWFDWRTVLQISVLPALIMGFAFIPMVKRIRPAHVHRFERSSLLALLKRWQTPLGIGLLVFAVLYNMSTVAAIAMTPLFLQTHHGLSTIETGVAFATMVIIGSLLQPVIGHVSDRVGRKVLLITVLGIGGAFAVAASLLSAFIPFLICLMAAVALLTGIRPVVLAAAVEVSGERESTTLGMAFTLMDGIGAFGAVIAGVAGRHDLSHAFLLAGVLALIASVIALCLPIRRAA
jgi:FSR family fosmidomycin resistance protein-like MFS transporter